MRVTLHFGRLMKKNGQPFSVKHNDRNFDITHAKHIDAAKTPQNIIRRWSATGMKTLDAAELDFYKTTFGGMLETRNERRVRQRKPQEMWSMDQVRKNPKYCPEEWILQVGQLDDTISKEQLDAIGVEFCVWHQKQFPNVRILDTALHIDEQGAPHIHGRQVWTYIDKDGNLNISQNKSLEEMNIPLPFPDKEEDKNNNRKITYSSMVREKLLDLCLQHGIEVEVEPKKKSQTSLSITEYKNRQEQAKLMVTQERVRQAETQIEKANRTALDIAKTISTAKATIESVKELRDKAEKITVGNIITGKRTFKALPPEDFNKLFNDIEQLARGSNLLTENRRLRQELTTAGRQVTESHKLIQRERTVLGQQIDAATRKLKEQLRQQEIELRQVNDEAKRLQKSYDLLAESEILPIWDALSEYDRRYLLTEITEVMYPNMVDEVNWVVQQCFSKRNTSTVLAREPWIQNQLQRIGVNDPEPYIRQVKRSYLDQCKAIREGRSYRFIPSPAFWQPSPSATNFLDKLIPPLLDIPSDICTFEEHEDWDQLSDREKEDLIFEMNVKGDYR